LFSKLIIPQIIGHFNEIAQSAMKSSFHSDEICYADEIKSTHPASSRISSPKGITPSKMISPTRKGGFS